MGTLASQSLRNRLKWARHEGRALRAAAQVYDTRADVYSWGVLLAELVAQKPPYDGMYLTPTQVRTLARHGHACTRYGMLLKDYERDCCG